MLDRSVRNRNLKFSIYRTPERRQHPTRAGGIFPTGHGSPYPGRREIDLFITEQRSFVERRLMIFAPGLSGVQKINSACLTSCYHELPPFEWKDCWGNLHIKIALLEPRPIPGFVPVA